MVANVLSKMIFLMISQFFVHVKQGLLSFCLGDSSVKGLFHLSYIVAILYIALNFCYYVFWEMAGSR